MLIDSSIQHFGRESFDAGQRIKAMLTPLEDVCRYHEQRAQDAATFDVKPVQKNALPFKIGIAPGGINLETSILDIRELPLSQAAIALALVEAILAGRVRQVHQIKGNGQIKVSKTYVFDEKNMPIFKQKKGSSFAYFSGKSVRSQRIRFSAYRKSGL